MLKSSAGFKVNYYISKFGSIFRLLLYNNFKVIITLSVNFLEYLNFFCQRVSKIA